MVLYRDAAGHAISFYVRPPGPRNRLLPTGQRMENGLMAQYWSGPGYNYAMVSRADGPARQVIEGFGGRLLCYFFMLGRRDGVAIAEFPDNESAVACSMRVASSGAFAAFETHALLTSVEAQQAMQKVKSTAAAYWPPLGPEKI